MSVPPKLGKDCKVEMLRGTDLVTKLAALTANEVFVEVRVTDDGRSVIIPLELIPLLKSGGTLLTPNSEGNLLKHFQWPAGGPRVVAGTFTKITADGTGAISIRPATGDQLMLLYGMIAAGAVKAAADVLDARISYQTGNVRMAGLASFTINAGEYCVIPGLGTTPSAGNITDGSRLFLIEDDEELYINLADMKFATSETFSCRIKFLSLLDTAPTVTAAGGTWA